MTELRVNCVSHPLIDHHLALLRGAATSSSDFRRSAKMLATLLAFSATHDLTTEETLVRTPLTETRGKILAQRVGLVPVLRAGLLMVDPLLDLIPAAEVWHLGIFRDESTAQPVHYYDKLPADRPVDAALILDPMLATGGTVTMVVDRLRAGSPVDHDLFAVVGSRGIEAVRRHCPDVAVYTCAVDERLNDLKYIVPGLGDAGDRGFNTVRTDS
ncbi:MAG: uracil phosphoribosyltransferase [Pirellulaceae bacterium]